ncbi:hypothetical protein PVAG01_09483 [Phlyctema vagabunda]|uniref:Ricin B lectin domain-containing protein n=1 Tax=Phlyctema vagabunda TaxID=108571 RepID=A0ABR4P7H3_9HELO
MNFDPRRAAGNQVIMFSCGGRADGGGDVTNSQLFDFTGGVEPGPLSPKNAAGTCFTVKNNVLDQASCQDGEASQVFSFGGKGTEATPSSSEASQPPSSTEDCFSTTMVTLTRSAAASTLATTAPSAAVGDSNPTTELPVSRAGGVLQPSAAAESNQRDTNAVRAFSSVSLKSSTGDCLSVDPTAGDFRQNLIPITVAACTGAAGEKWDLITSGTHNNDASGNSTLIVSALTQGCLNFDPRRAAGDTVILFSCGGRADGEGSTANSQLFPLVKGQDSIVITPENAEGTCLVGKGGKLDSAACSGSTDQSFAIV